MASATDSQPLSPAAVESSLLEFIRSELLGSSTEIDREDDLLSGDFLDSVAVLRLAAFVQEEFDLSLQPSDFVVENFQNAAVLAGYVCQRTAQAPPLADSQG